MIPNSFPLARKQTKIPLEERGSFGVIRSWLSDEPDATPASRDKTGFTKVGWIFHFAQCARNEIYVSAQNSELERADRPPSDMAGLDF